MTEEADNLILRYLRSIDAKVDKITTDLGEVKARLFAVEQHVIALSIDIETSINAMTRVEDRLAGLSAGWA